MSYCSKCIHREVCGHEGVDDSAMTYCADRLLVCDDYISRQAVIGIVDCLSDDVASSVLGGVERAVEELKKIPVIKKQSLSIPTVLVKGYWVYNDKESDAIIESYNCSICGYTKIIDSLIETVPNFYEHCGAKNKIK